MVNISSIVNTITNIDGVINDDASQIEALNVSLFWFFIKYATGSKQIGNYNFF